MQAVNLLANGMGGLDWAGLPLISAYLGVSDVEAFLDALRVIKTHQPPKPGDDAPPEPDDPLRLG